MCLGKPRVNAIFHRKPLRRGLHSAAVTGPPHQPEQSVRQPRASGGPAVDERAASVPAVVFCLYTERRSARMPRLIGWSALALAAVILAGCGSSTGSSTPATAGFNDPHYVAKSVEQGGPERVWPRLHKVTHLP